MNQLTGKIISVVARPGYVPSLDIQVEISNSDDDEQVAFVWMMARVSFGFVPRTKELPSRGQALDAGVAVPRYILPYLRKTANTDFMLPFDERLLTDLERAREKLDVVMYVSISFNAIVKNPRVVAGPQELPQGGTVADPRYSGQEIVHIIPRSQWEEIIEGLGISVVDTQRKLKEYEIKGKQALEGLEETVKAAKEAAKLVGVVEHAKIFEEEALSHRRSAHWWLFFTIILALFAGGIAYLNFLRAEHLVVNVLAEKMSPQDAKASDAKPDGLTGLQIQLAVAKLIILSILLSASIWAGKVYKSHRHNFVVNRHRSNALTTFQTFAMGTSDPQIKNAVLLQATNCIFGQQNTGYITQDKDSDTYPQILEIVRGINPGKGE